ncbi:MAG TPA: hypothetical protein VHI13_14175 [Candidatus Kapabacteria bacterium]|nr:hypothetical protein [Candidatus Kapabacteria bacterium]
MSIKNLTVVALAALLTFGATSAFAQGGKPAKPAAAADGGAKMKHGKGHHHHHGHKGKGKKADAGK